MLRALQTRVNVCGTYLTCLFCILICFSEDAERYNQELCVELERQKQLGNGGGMACPLAFIYLGLCVSCESG